MGDVVKLQKPAQKKKGTQAKPRTRRPRRSRTALVLGGGGFTGGVYEIGALRALDAEYEGLVFGRLDLSSYPTSRAARERC